MVIDCVIIAKFDSPVLGRLVRLKKRYDSMRIIATEPSDIVGQFCDKLAFDSASVESCFHVVRLVVSSLIVNLSLLVANLKRVDDFKDVVVASTAPLSFVPYNLQFLAFFKVIE